MNERTKAEFILAIIANENLQISAAVASQMTECQEWMNQIIKTEIEKADEAGFTLTEASKTKGK